MSRFINLYKVPLLLAILAIALYIFFGHYIARSNFTTLILCYGVLFSISYALIEKLKLNFWFLVGLGIVLRFVFIIAIPNLSQDFYRFLWDGRLLAQGINPYLFTPQQFVENLPPKYILGNWASETWSSINIMQESLLHQGMGSLNASHFSNYPPINQLFFAIAALFAGKSILGSVIVLRVIMILADLGILYFGKKLLKKLNLPIKNVFWYFLNPFIIIELTGNLHFEGVMLFFLVWALYLLFKKKWVWAAVLIGVSISVKLLPLLFLPLFIKYLAKQNKTSKVFKASSFAMGRLFLFYFSIGATVILTFFPFISSEFLQNFSATISLWFQNFEFNASVYYIIRWIGFQVVGWNVIGTVGKILPILVLLFILSISFFRKNQTTQQLITAMLFAVSFYLFFATTVHPWYVATPLLLSVFTRYKFPIVWSFMVILSYSAYGKDGFDENLWLVALEYIVVIGVAIYEIGISNRNLNNIAEQT
ncbi:glycosyltransferase 87 family protein [Aequorivita marina]|uniref:glycosyltransferase 87 family protein n=1 Tax=Aequorivita marina TaxID=3073654 RepID=UPI0028771602|nr:glycosyltransferase 87 family protein [Aequorivita sp. S2608]MDS1298505.1 glycosyltransferase 87 family protein [Aequorivita sp. S2608]